MALERDAGARNRNGTIGDGISVETALDWYDRSQRNIISRNKKRRRRNGSASSSWNDGGKDEEFSDNSDVHTAADPSMAAWRFLRFGKSGIAPIDAAWKRSRDDSSAHKRYRPGPGRGQRRPIPPFSLPPVTILEGPRDVGKTWMLLTLAARFVVATMASRFKDCNNSDEGKNNDVEATNEMQKGNPSSDCDRDRDSGDGDGDGDCKDDIGNRSNNDQPKVLLLDSTYDFCVSQLVNVVRSTLSRERQRQRVRGSDHREHQLQGQHQNITGNKVVKNNGAPIRGKHSHHQHDQERKIEEELERQEREKISFEQDMEDCLSRIHVIQVDNGSTGWVPMLEVLTFQLSEDRRRYSGCSDTVSNVRPMDAETSPSGPPTLLLWDGFLSDMAPSSDAMAANASLAVLGDSIGTFSHTQALFESPGAQELLRQISRLLQKEPDTLWLVLTTRTVSVTAAAAKFTKNAASDSYTPATTEQSGIGLKMTEWIRKEEERRRRKGENDSRLDREEELRNRRPIPNPQRMQPQRASYRVRLERHRGSGSCIAGEGRIPRTAAVAAALFAKVLVSGGANLDSGDGTNHIANDGKIPYSISLGGILS